MYVHHNILKLSLNIDAFLEKLCIELKPLYGVLAGLELSVSTSHTIPPVS